MTPGRKNYALLLNTRRCLSIIPVRCTFCNELYIGYIELAEAISATEFAALWEKLACAHDAVLQEFSFENFITVDDEVAVTASLLDAETVIDVAASGDMENNNCCHQKTIAHAQYLLMQSP